MAKRRSRLLGVGKAFEYLVVDREHGGTRDRGLTNERCDVGWDRKAHLGAKTFPHMLEQAFTVYPRDDSYSSFSSRDL